MSEQRLFDRALDDVGRDAKETMLDSLYSTLFNLANDLDYNTAEHDLSWYAEAIYCTMHDYGCRFDLLANDQKDYWHQVARASLDALPQLMHRIAHRSRVHAQVIDEMMRAQRRIERKAR